MNTNEHYDEHYDVVIAGAGVAGALMAKYLTRAGFKVLVLEAGPESATSFAGYQEHLRHFYAASSKGAESAWPPDPHAPQPDSADIKQNNGYFIQQGPDRYGSSYSRLRGGSTLHWLGVSLRMLPEDFQLHSRYGVGRDWPLRYTDLEPYYCKAEYELGVAADVAEQRYHGLTFSEGYDYPMRRVPPTYSDRKLAAAVDGMNVDLGDGPVPLKIRTFRRRATLPRALATDPSAPSTSGPTVARLSYLSASAVRATHPAHRSVRFKRNITPAKPWRRLNARS